MLLDSRLLQVMLLHLELVLLVLLPLVLAMLLGRPEPLRGLLVVLVKGLLMLLLEVLLLEVLLLDDRCRCHCGDRTGCVCEINPGLRGIVAKSCTKPDGIKGIPIPKLHLVHRVEKRREEEDGRGWGWGVGVGGGCVRNGARRKLMARF